MENKEGEEQKEPQ
jgi:hypothetical protein